MSSLIDTAKIVYDLAKKGMSIDLQEKLMQLREEALELQEENLNLKKENLKLKEQIEFQEKVQFKKKVYFRDGDTIPLCPYCYEKSKHLIHLSQETGAAGREQEIYKCQECGTEYSSIRGDDFTIYVGRLIRK
ncbi:MAG: hypothetical protein ABII09_04295 [Planctomycetota bacterium]